MKTIIIIFVIFLIVVNILVIYKNKILKQDNLKCKDCNIILISIDTLRADHLGCYGYDKNTSPNIDKFASKGVLFKNYIVQGYLTPVSQITLFTSQYVSNLGINTFNFVLNDTILTLPQILKIYDYKTAAFSTSPEFSDVFLNLNKHFSRGFDIYECGYERELPSKSTVFGWLKENKDNKFFLWLPIGTAHWPYGVHVNNSIKNMFIENNYSGAFYNKSYLNWPDLLSIYNLTYYKDNYTIQLDESDINYIISLYDSGIFTVDYFLGWIFNEISKLNLDKNTIIVIHGIHGEELNEHNYITHYDIYDTEIKSPFIIVGPNIQKRVVDAQIQSIDVLPTLLEIVDINIPRQSQGKSFASIIEGKKDEINDYVFSERIPIWEYLIYTNEFLQPNLNGTYTFSLSNITLNKHFQNFAYKNMIFFDSHPNFYYNDITIRTNEWKLIYRNDPEILEKISMWSILINQSISVPKLELYNLKEDPYEKNNLINEEPEIAMKLQKKLFDWNDSITEKGINSNINIIRQPYP